MADDISLLRRARINLNSVKQSLGLIHVDECYIDDAAYNIQQAIEKLLKFLMTATRAAGVAGLKNQLF